MCCRELKGCPLLGAIFVHVSKGSFHIGALILDAIMLSAVSEEVYAYGMSKELPRSAESRKKHKKSLSAFVLRLRLYQ